MVLLLLLVLELVLVLSNPVIGSITVLVSEQDIGIDSTIALWYVAIFLNVRLILLHSYNFSPIDLSLSNLLSLFMAWV